MTAEDAHAKRGPGAYAAERFGAFVAGLGVKDIPEPVRHAAMLRMLDTVGVAIAAAALPGEADSARASVAVLSGMGGAAEASMIGSQHVPAANAAYANAALSHAIDFDDIHTDSRVHVSAIVVPAALAVGERQKASGSDVIVAMVAGNEVATRIGMGGPWHFQRRGFHATPVCGVFGAAAAAASLLELDAESVTRAIGVAADTAGGTNAWIAEGTSNKHLHAGWAAHNGVLSAQLASEGAKGPRGALEGRFGLYETLAGAPDVDLDPVLATLGARWETPTMAFKAYPACYWSHASIEAAARMREDVLSSIDDIETIEAIVPSAAVPLVLDPREPRVRPATPYAAKFSLQHAIAAMLLRGVIDLTTYTPGPMSDERVLELAARVEWVVSDELDAADQVYPGGLRVRMRGGSEHVEQVLDPLGTERNPMTERELVEKFRANASFGLEPDDARNIEHEIIHVEDASSLEAIGDLLRRVRPR